MYFVTTAVTMAYRSWVSPSGRYSPLGLGMLTSDSGRAGSGSIRSSSTARRSRSASRINRGGNRATTCMWNCLCRAFDGCPHMLRRISSSTSGHEKTMSSSSCCAMSNESTGIVAFLRCRRCLLSHLRRLHLCLPAFVAAGCPTPALAAAFPLSAAAAASVVLAASRALPVSEPASARAA